jgi:hypothetical protein
MRYVLANRAALVYVTYNYDSKCIELYIFHACEYLRTRVRQIVALLTQIYTRYVCLHLRLRKYIYTYIHIYMHTHTRTHARTYISNIILYTIDFIDRYFKNR